MFLACSLKSPHASAPTVESEVFINEEQSVGNAKTRWARVEWSTHRIAVPLPETWTLDTVRAVLAALRHFLPVHQLNDAHVGVKVYGQRPVKSVIFSVRARGWESEVYVPSLRNKQAVYNARCERNGLNFTEPMIAALRDLQAQSPIPLATIAPIDAAITSTPAPFCDDLDFTAMLKRLPSKRKALVLQAMKTILKGIVDRESGGDDDE